MPSYDIQKAARLLEWDRVTDRLAEFADSEPGRRRCRELPFLDDPDRIDEALADVGEARGLLERGIAVNFGAVVDLGAMAKRARVGSALTGSDLLVLAELLRLSRRTKKLFETEAIRLPRLSQRANVLLEQVALEKEIFARIERDGRVADNASPELAQLRDRYRAVHTQIHAVLEKIIAAPEYEELLQEKLFSLRNGRFVVPVRVERRHAVDGIVHDISQTGQSLFIEPRPITELNNRLRTAELEIEREIYRILLELTYKVGAVIDEIETAVETLTGLDLVFAKARYSLKIGAQPVEVSRSGEIHLPRLRHPLLIEQLATVIPNDLRLGVAGTLVLSGPNTGGKTVLLKTIGLAALMLRAGLHLPCGPDGRLPVFKRLFAVIGDEQSIERNLSSFSSHLLNLKNILDELVPHSLVLIDEIGEGTDPTQGVALARAILDELHQHGARTIVTTHFAELMAEAQVREGWTNAAMAFDEVAMTPTYHLLTGMPGRSSAFAIAERLGLPRAVVARARSLAAGTDTRLEQVIRQLEEDRQKWRTLSEQAEEAWNKAEAEKKRQQDLLAELRTKKDKLLAIERESLKAQLDEAREAVRQVIKDLQAGPSFAEAERTRERLKEIEREQERIFPARSEPVPAFLLPIADWSAVPAGSEVVVHSLGESATVLEPPDAHGRVRLQVRDKRLTLPAEQCYMKRDLVPEPPEREPGGVSVVGAEPDESLIRLDLRGQTADDALLETECFLDQAMRLRLPQVAIIHGHGTGVLKRTIREYLRRCPYARSWRPGERGEGSDGVTMVELDL
ncbi:MAG: endonuclease MutS2 [Myxococcales bacterium]|nr:endonuclease MutS2 [Myxococcales bacterium]